jgi:Rieske Fe-S protein
MRLIYGGLSVTIENLSETSVLETRRGVLAGGTGGTALGATSEIPDGGGKIFTTEKVVVTQPKSGEYKAFSAICTHMGCTVSTVSNETIDCPCHGSKFSITDGAVVAGPAPGPLPSTSIKVSGGDIVLS